MNTTTPRFSHFCGCVLGGGEPNAYCSQHAPVPLGDSLFYQRLAMETPAVAVEETLDKRGERYGAFKDQATISQCILSAMMDGRNWTYLAPDMRESLHMIASKIARILNGDPNYADSWHDIAGYARLIEKRLTKEI